MPDTPIPEPEDDRRNYFDNVEEACLRRLLGGESIKVLTPEDMTRKIEGLEMLIKMLFDRLHQIDGKRLLNKAIPEGETYEFFNHREHGTQH